MSADRLHAVPTPPPATSVDDLVRRYNELQQRAEEIGAEQRSIRDQLETLVGVGNTIKTSFGTKVTVQAPSRRFDVKVAAELLRQRDPDALERCHLEGFDSAKIRRHLTAEQLEWSMIAGTGSNIVKIT